MIISGLITPLNSNDNKITELESIRGLAALLIVFFHFPGWNLLFYNISFIRNGYLMVDLFFVLSGFVIYKSYGKKINSKKELIQFQFLRFGRLYPVHILFLGFFVCVEIMRYIASIKLGIYAPRETPFKENSFSAIIQHMFLIQAIGPTGNSLTFNSPAWSISVEFYTYFIFGIIVLYAKKFKLPVFIISVFVSLTLLANHVLPEFSDLLHCISGFFLGCITAKICDTLKIHFESYMIFFPVISMVFFLVINNSSRCDYIIFFITPVLIATVVLSGKGIVKKVLNWKALAWLGTVSYSIYMSHWAVIWAVQQVFRLILKKPQITINGNRCSQLSVLETCIAYSVSLLFIFIISHIVNKKVEVPLRQKSRDFVSGNKFI